MKNPVTRSSPGALNLHDSKIFYILSSSLQYLRESLTSENLKKKNVKWTFREIEMLYTT